MPHPINKITDILGPGAMARPLQYTKPSANAPQNTGNVMNHSDNYKLGYCEGSLIMLKQYLDELGDSSPVRLARATVNRTLALLHDLHDEPDEHKKADHER